MRSRLLKMILFSYGVCILSFSLLYGYILKKDYPPGLEVLPGENLRNQSGEPYDNFRVEHISVVRKKDNKPHFVLTADEVVHRKRASKLFLYQNLKEIYVSGAKVDIYLNNISSSGNSSLPFDEMNEIFASLGKQSTSLDDYSAGKVADSDLDLLSRIFFENLSLNIYYPDSKKISFSALYASVTPDLNNLVFSGTVQFTDSMRRKFVSSKVVWSKKHNGIYFPEGYTLQNSQHRNKSFYAVSKDGDFSRLSDIPAIDYADYLEVAESRLYAKLMKKLPPYAKMMLGLPMQ
jgi:hypothetical protein